MDNYGALLRTRTRIIACSPLRYPHWAGADRRRRETGSNPPAAARRISR